MTSLDGRARAGPDGKPDASTVRATPRRPEPSAEQSDSPESPESASGPGATPTNGTHTGPGTGTLRRSRAPRPDGGDPTHRFGPGERPPAAPPPMPVPPPADLSQPPRRPVPPTFPSPGQPPPGVARRDGRHSRPDVRGEQTHTPPNGYRPRHAAPDAETEQFPLPTAAAAPPTEGPQADPATDSAPFPATAGKASTALATAPAGPGAKLHPVGPADKADYWDDDVADGDDPFDDPSDRVRVVLAGRRAPTRAVRTVAEIEAQTETGELLLGNLLRAQLTLAVRLGLVAVLLLGALPVLFLVLPVLGSVDLLGLRVPWLLLGIAPYPFLVVLGWLYIRTAERNERDFAENVED